MEVRRSSAPSKSTNSELINDQGASVHNTQRAYVTVRNQRLLTSGPPTSRLQFQAVADPQINVLHEAWSSTCARRSTRIAST